MTLPGTQQSLMASISVILRWFGFRFTQLLQPLWSPSRGSGPVRSGLGGQGHLACSSETAGPADDGSSDSHATNAQGMECQAFLKLPAESE